MKPDPKRSVQAESGSLVVGVLSDTHIPDQVVELHPLILPIMREAGVCQILHAGDIATRRVLTDLAELAPVTAVRGNRDLLLNDLPLVANLQIGGVEIALMHGHGGWKRYLRNKLKALLQGYRLSHHTSWMAQAAGPARVIVFGHSHFPEQVWRAGRLFFNPGTATFFKREGFPPTIGLLYIRPNGKVKTQILPLKGYQVKNRRWVKDAD